MHSRITNGLTALALAGVLALPALAQARGGSDDPANHEQREHQVSHHRRHDRVDNDRRRHHRVDNDRRRHDRVDNDRRDRRGSDDGPNHR